MTKRNRKINKKKKNLLYNKTNKIFEIQDYKNQQDALPYKLCIDIAKDEYRIERERTRVLENKAQLFLTLSVALLSFISNTASISQIVVFYKKISDITSIMVVTTSIAFVFIAVMLIIYATYLLYKIISTKPFMRITTENIFQTETFNRNENEVAEGLINHYKKVIASNITANSQNASDLQKAINCLSIGIFICLVATFITNTFISIKMKGL